MSYQTFFKTSSQNIKNLVDQAELLGNIEDRHKLWQISNQLKISIEKYKQLVAKIFDLLWEKRNEFNLILSNNLHSPPLMPEQYKVIDKKLMQLECDINTLNKVIKQERLQEKIEQYEIKLSDLSSRSGFVP